MPEKRLTLNSEKRKLNDNWYVGGKVDGITDNNEIIEIKNRMYKLFFKLRDYEKTQVYGYLYIFNTQKAILLEKLKKKTDSKINIIEIEYKDVIFEHIKSKLMKFCVFFDHFLNLIFNRCFLILAPILAPLLLYFRTSFCIDF